MSVTTVVDMIRHGEPVGGKKYRGQRDDPLSELGWHQMRSAVGDHAPWQLVISSTLSRCRAFADELTSRHRIPVEYEARLVEIGFGAWEGRTAHEIMRDEPEAIANFWRDPLRYTPPGAEPLADFSQRVSEAWQALLARCAGKHVLLVCHAGVIRMIIRQVLDMPVDRVFRIDVPNAGITRIEVDGVGETALPRLVFHAGVL